MMSSHTGQVDFPARQATLISIFKIAQEESALASCLPTTKTYKKIQVPVGIELTILRDLF